MCKVSYINPRDREYVKFLIEHDLVRGYQIAEWVLCCSYNKDGVDSPDFELITELMQNSSLELDLDSIVKSRVDNNYIDPKTDVPVVVWCLKNGATGPRHYSDLLRYFVASASVDAMDYFATTNTPCNFCYSKTPIDSWVDALNTACDIFGGIHDDMYDDCGCDKIDMVAFMKHCYQNVVRDLSEKRRWISNLDQLRIRVSENQELQFYKHLKSLDVWITELKSS